VSRPLGKAALVTGLAACLTGITGCGGGDASSTAPVISPASGRRVDLAVFSARTPHEFEYDHTLAKEIVFSGSPDHTQEIAYSDVSVFPGTTNAFAARLSIKNSQWSPRPTLAAPVTFAGVRWYHLTGPVGQGHHLEEFGSVQHSRLVKLSFELSGPPAPRKTLVDSVLSTVTLK
jgi:hypothetical protein